MQEWAQVVYYGYLPMDGRPLEWNHEALLARIDPANIAANVMDLCQQLHAMWLAFRSGGGRGDQREFARITGLPERVPLAAKRTVTGWVPPSDAKTWTVMPKTTMFKPQVSREIGFALGLDGRLCATCGEEMSLGYFGAAPGYEGRSEHLKVSGAGEAYRADHCYLCGRAKRLETRLGVIQKYGGGCQCCGETTYEFLAMDHVGGEKPAGMMSYGEALHRQLLAVPRRDDYRVLCHQCNWAYYQYGQKCPHQWTSPDMSLTAQSLMSVATASYVLDAKSTKHKVLEEVEYTMGMMGVTLSDAADARRMKNQRNRDMEVVDVDMSAYDTSVVATIPVGSYKAVVDLHRLPEVVQHRWRLNKQNGRVYVVAGLPPKNGKQQSLYLHRLIAKPAPGEWVRHVDGNGLNNLSDNLRITRSPSSLKAK